jgi:hypothetical protein
VVDDLTDGHDGGAQVSAVIEDFDQVGYSNGSTR